MGFGMARETNATRAVSKHRGQLSSMNLPADCAGILRRMAQIATEILGLSKMNWNSFGLYSKLPCTIESSNEIARIGWLLSQFEGSLYDYRFFMWPLILYNAWQKYTVLQQQTHLIFFLSILEYLQPDILPKNMVQNICMPDGIFRYSSLKVNLYEEIFIVYF